MTDGSFCRQEKERLSGALLVSLTRMGCNQLAHSIPSDRNGQGTDRGISLASRCEYNRGISFYASIPATPISNHAPHPRPSPATTPSLDDQGWQSRLEPKRRSRAGSCHIGRRKGWPLFRPDGGTSFLKPKADIDKAAVRGFDAIKRKLDELEPGESIVIRGTGPSDQVLEYCEKLGLKAWRHP